MQGLPWHIPPILPTGTVKEDRITMAGALKLEFVPFSKPARGVLVVFCDEGLNFGSSARRILAASGDLVTRAAEAEQFKGKNGSVLDILAPAGLDVARLVVVGAGKTGDLKASDFVKLGGVAMGKVPGLATQVTIIADVPGHGPKPDEAADLALGARLRGYSFDRYKTKRKEGEEKPQTATVTIGVSDPPAAKKAWLGRQAVADGVVIARDLINEPANVLYPQEFARRAEALKKVGVSVEVLDEKTMKKLGMHALLGVGQGSVRDSQVVIMRWNGGKKGADPVAFIGKGVCFDTGGISIKPAA